MPPMGSHGDEPVKARAFTLGAPGGAGLAGTAGALLAGVPFTAASAWAISRSTAPEPVEAVDTPEAPRPDRPLSRWRLTPSALAFAELGPVSLWPSATVMTDSRGVPAKRVTVWPGATLIVWAGRPAREPRSTVTSAGP